MSPSGGEAGVKHCEDQAQMNDRRQNTKLYIYKLTYKTVQMLIKHR